MTLEELSQLAEPEGFSAFVIVTKQGLRAQIPHPEFIDIPPEGASFVTIYRTGQAHMPCLIDLDAIDHIDLNSN